MAIPGVVSVAGTIGPTDLSDIHACIDPIYGVDGLRSVADITARDNITIPRRRYGMIVFVQSDENYYQLDNDLVSWINLGPTLGGAGGVVASGTITPSSVEDIVLGATADFSAKKIVLSLVSATKAYGSEIFVSKDHTVVLGFSISEFNILGDISIVLQLAVVGPNLVLQITNNEIVNIDYKIITEITSLGGGAHTIEDEGTPLLQRSTINFTGAGVTVTDSGGKTVVNVTGGGDVVGPGSSVDNTIPRFDLTTGKVLQTSGVTISDSNDVSNVTSLSVTNRTSTRDVQLSSINTPPGSPSAGNIYYDSDYNCLMYYDSTRSKWLSSDCYTFTVSSDNSSIGAGVSLRVGVTPTNSSPILLGPVDTCLVGINVTTASTEDFVLGVDDLVSGLNTYTYNIPTGTYYSDHTLNDNFDANNAVDVFISSLGSSGNVDKPVVTLIFRRRK